MEAPSGRSSASRPLRPTLASTAAVPVCRRTRDRSGRALRSATRIRSLATTAGSSVSTIPRWRSAGSTPARLRAVRPGSARSTVTPWTWTLRIRTVRSPGTSRRMASGPVPRPRNVPVTTTPRPLTAKTRSMARRTPCAPGRGTSATHGAAGSPTTASRRSARRFATPRSRRHPPTRRRGWATRPGRALEQAGDAGDDLSRARRPGHIGLGDDREPVPDLERVEQGQVLDGLGARPVIRGHHEQRRVDLNGATSMLPTSWS